MDCLKSQNQCINTVMFPGSFTPSSYTSDTFKSSFSNLRMLYIPFTRKICTNFSDILAAPTYIPVLLATCPHPQTNLFCIHFHGNACDVGQIAGCAHREANAYRAHYLLVEYPGYGISDGYANEVVMNEISRAVHSFVIHELRVNYRQVVLIGRSIGTGPACSLASYLELIGMPPMAVILQSPFTSIRDAASDLLGGLSYAMMDRWQNWTKLIGKEKSVIKAPVLFIHADQDKVISCHHSTLMHEYRAASGLSSELHIQRSTEKCVKGHNYFDYERDVVHPCKDFLSRQIHRVVGSSGPLLAIDLPADIIQTAQRVPAGVSARQIAITERQSSDAATGKKPNNGSVAKNLKCDRYVIGGWMACPCFFCAEAWVACSYSAVRSCCIAVGVFQPRFDYQTLRPNDGTQGSVMKLLVRKKSFDKAVSEEEAMRSHRQAREETINPLNPGSAGQRNRSRSGVIVKGSIHAGIPTTDDSDDNSAIDRGEEKADSEENGIELPFATIISVSSNRNCDDNSNEEKSFINYIPG